jgi:tetratricopeptide (TPR) repeat protein
MVEIIDYWVEEDPELVKNYLGGYQALDLARRSRGKAKEKALSKAIKFYNQALAIAYKRHPQIEDRFYQNVNDGLKAAYWGLGSLYQDRGKRREAQHFLEKSKEHNISIC